MKIRKYLAALLAAAMLPMCSAAISAEEPITAEEVQSMLFADNITTVSDSGALLETEYYNKQNRPSGAIKNYIDPSQAIRIHFQSSDGSPEKNREWLAKSKTDWNGWYYLLINEGDYTHMNFNPVDSTANDGTSNAYYYMSMIDDITDFGRIADALSEVDGITSIKFYQYEYIYDSAFSTDKCYGFKIESANGTKYLPIRSIYNEYAAIAGGGIKSLSEWQVYDADYAAEFIEQTGKDHNTVDKMIYEDMGAEYTAFDEPVRDTDTLSRYIGSEPVFSDISSSGCTPNQAAAVNALADLSFMNGYEDGSFRPSASVTRAEAAIMMYKLLGLGDGAQLNNELTDIDGHWAEKEISAVAAAGIINGYEDYTFRPDQNIEYHHFLKMLTGVLTGAAVVPYDEQNIIKTSITFGLTNNIGDFEPSDEIPRIHAASAAAAALDCHIATCKFFYAYNTHAVSSSYDITLIDFLNGEKPHGLDLRLKYDYDRFYDIINSYDNIITEAYLSL